MNKLQFCIALLIMCELGKIFFVKLNPAVLFFKKAEHLASSYDKENYDPHYHRSIMLGRSFRSLWLNSVLCI